jgi:hypothetical protein
MKITIEQLIDIVQADLTVSGMLPKMLPDIEIERLIKEKALDWFYKNYQFSVQKTYYYLSKDCVKSDEYTKKGYITMPSCVEGITRIAMINDPSLFQIGFQSPNLSISMGTTNTPYLSSFVTNIGELATYRQTLSYFSNELNKMAKNFIRHSFNHINKRLEILDSFKTNLILDVTVQIQQEELFDNYLFKDFVIGLSRVKLGQVLAFTTAPMIGGFNYNADAMKTEGQALIDKVEEKVKGESTSGWFIMSK